MNLNGAFWHVFKTYARRFLGIRECYPDPFKILLQIWTLEIIFLIF